MTDLLSKINRCTYHTEFKHKEYFKPSNETELVKVITELKHKNIQTCSSGMNWGYGSKLGNKTETSLVDLSNLKEIEMNEKHGYVVIEPGVTQKDLYDTLIKQKSNLILSLTGSSPNSSIIGNMMGFGYGNGQSTVRVEDVIQVNGFDHNKSYKKNIDQSTCKYSSSSISNILIHDKGSIITKSKLRLKQIPEHLLLTSFSIKEDNDFSELIHQLNQLKKAGIIEGNWSVFSAHRLLAEQGFKENLTTAIDKMITYEEAKEILKSWGYNVWNGKYNGVFACYLASDGISLSTKEYIQNKLGNVVDKLVFTKVTKKDILNERTSNNGFSHLAIDPPILSRLRTFAGILKNGSIEIIYWKKKEMIKNYEPDDDKCGFIWLATSIPNDHSLINQFKNEVNTTLKKHDIDPIFVIDGVLPHETYFMVSLIYDLEDLREEEKIKTAFETLKRKSKELGVINYKEITPFK